MHDIARLMLLQGPRPAEVMEARVDHVNLERGTWYIPKSKSAPGKRILRLTADARSILGARIAAAPASGWLFEGKKPGTHLTDIENAHKAILGAAGLAFVLYDLRHTFATRFYEATCDVEALRKVPGHSILRTIQKYVHVSQDHVDGAMKGYETIWGQLGANASAQTTNSDPTSVKNASVTKQSIQ